MQLSLLDLTMNGTRECMKFTHLTKLMLLHYVVEVERVKM